MRGRDAITVLVWLLVFAASGCQLFRDDWVGWNAVDSSDPVVVVLRHELNKDRWTPDVSRRRLLRDTQSQAQLRRHSDRLRSKFDQRLATELLERLDDQSGKNGNAPFAYLEIVARDNSLAGWNAAILLAHKNPRRAIPFAPRLQELVESRVYYNPTTGRRTQPPVKRIRKKPPPGETAGKPVSNVHRYDDYSLKQLLDVANDARAQATGGADRSVWDRIAQPFRNDAGTSQTPVPSRAVSTTMRIAAAEAWCRVLAAGESVPIDAMAPAGRLLGRVTLPQSVRDELALGIAREISPGRIPGLTDAFTRNFTTVEDGQRTRRLAMRACVVHAIRLRTNADATSSGHSPPKLATEWPASIHDRATDPDPVNRKLYGRWLALTRADDASVVLATHRGDIDDGVQTASIVSLGLLETDDARRTLRDLADSKNAAHRSAAVRAISPWGVRELARFLRDPATTVRVALAQELERLPAGGLRRSSSRSSREAATLMMRLVQDQQLGVQTACLKSIKHWPDRLAIPVLIRAIRHGAAATQIQAWQKLRLRKPHGRRFPLNSEARSAAIAGLINDLKLDTDISGSSLAEVAGLRRVDRKRYEEQVAREIGVMLRETHPSTKIDDAVQILSRLDREALPIVEAAISRSQRAYPQRVYRALYDKVLPELHPAWTALRDLDDRNPFVRRRAGTALAELGRKRSLSPLMVETLRRRIRDWNDGLLWSAALDAVMADNHPEGDRLAIDASHIEDSTVQMRALKYFERHAQSRFAGRILELMNGERSPSVRLAAIRAAGFCRHPDLESGKPAEAGHRGGSVIAARRGLRDWILSPDPDIREAAALSLARFGSELGYRELYRRSFAPDPKQRVRAYRMMAETGQRRFVEHLVQRGRSDGNTSARKAILTSLDELVPADEKPVGLSAATGYDERIRAWNDWLKRRSVRKASRPPEIRSADTRAPLPPGKHTSPGHRR